MQARFSKNNNFGGTLRTERNTFTLALFSQLFHHNATNSSLKYFFFHSQRSLLMSVSCNIQKPPSIFFPPVLYRSEITPHFELNILTAHRGKHLLLHVFDRKVSYLIP